MHTYLCWFICYMSTCPECNHEEIFLNLIHWFYEEYPGPQASGGFEVRRGTKAHSRKMQLPSTYLAQYWHSAAPMPTTQSSWSSEGIISFRCLWNRCIHPDGWRIVGGAFRWRKKTPATIAPIKNIGHLKQVLSISQTRGTKKNNLHLFGTSMKSISCSSFWIAGFFVFKGFFPIGNLPIRSFSAEARTKVDMLTCVFCKVKCDSDGRNSCAVRGLEHWRGWVATYV